MFALALALYLIVTIFFAPLVVRAIAAGCYTIVLLPYALFLMLREIAKLIWAVAKRVCSR